MLLEDLPKISDLTEKKKIGSGTYGAVYKALHGNEVVAVKELNDESDIKGTINK